MSLLDMIASSDAGSPEANYLRGGRHVIKISRVTWRDPTPKQPKASFRIDGEILKTNSAAHADQIGMQGTMNLGFRYPESDGPRAKRALRACLEAATGDKVAESVLTSAKIKELIGETQPLRDAIIVVMGNEAPQEKDKSKTFTKYEVEVPTLRDLDGLI